MPKEKSTKKTTEKDVDITKKTPKKRITKKDKVEKKVTKKTSKTKKTSETKKDINTVKENKVYPETNNIKTGDIKFDILKKYISFLLLLIILFFTLRLITVLDMEQKKNEILTNEKIFLEETLNNINREYVDNITKKDKTIKLLKDDLEEVLEDNNKIRLEASKNVQKLQKIEEIINR